MSGSSLAALRRDAADIFAAAVRAADPLTLVHGSLPGVLPRGAPRARIVAAGKAAVSMATAASGILGRDARDCIVVAPHDMIRGADLPDALLIGAGHPLPDAGSIAAGRAVIDLLSNSDPDVLTIVLLSGGASALLCMPAPGISLDDYRAVTTLLLGSGATIAEINCVRRHIDLLKGGGLARAAGRVPIVALVISDVVDNALDVIASGPLSADRTSFGDALSVLERYSLVHGVPAAVLRHLDDGVAGKVVGPLRLDAEELRQVRIEIIADNGTARNAAVGRAMGLGYTVEHRAEPVAGAAAAAGVTLAEWLNRAEPDLAETVGSCLVAGGETTVTLQGHQNSGGRNQELALAAALAIEGSTDCVLLSGGTDGVDGTTDAAGGIVDGGTAGRIRTGGIDPEAALRRHDSHRTLRAAGDLLVTGPTGTNVMDLQVALKRNARQAGT